jgi:endoglucanase
MSPLGLTNNALLLFCLISLSFFPLKATTPVVNSEGTWVATKGVAFSYQIVASNSPTSYSATGLPAGLTINTTSGVISGIPTTVGVSPVTLWATNGSGTNTAILVLTVVGEMAKGADVGWLQQMAASSPPFQFYDSNGQQLDPDQVTNCLKILRERNIDTIRLRVFVPPITAPNWDNQLSGNCTIPEVVSVAAKAHALGFRLLIDLHYSWTFADPGNQRIPVNWANEITGMSHAQAVTTLANEISAHTTDVLTQLKAAGVTPEWLQVGNEVTNGMLTEIQDNPANPGTNPNGINGGADLAAFVNAGYNAVKAIDPNIKVIVHIDRAHSDSVDKGFFTALQSNGGKWDVSGSDCSSGTFSDMAFTMNDLAASFNQPGQGGDGVMMCEIEPPDIYESNGTYNPNPNFDYVTSVLNLMRAVPNGKGLGAVYWEPEADPAWRGYLQSAWTNHEPSSALDSMRPSILQAAGLNIVNATGQNVQLTGVNLGGWMVMEPWMTPADSSGLPDEYSIIQTLDNRFGVTTEQSLIQTYRQSWITSSDLDNIKAQGLNVVRVPVWWGDFYTLSSLGTANPVMRSDAFAVLDAFVTAASEHGIYTIIDMHGVFGGQSVSDDTGQENQNQYWTNANDQANTQLMWSAIAAHYNGNAWIAGYDLLNEPSGAPSNDAVITQLENLYTTVRAADPTHIIFMEGTFGNPWGWGSLPDPASEGWTNVVYEMHEYQYAGTVAAVETGAENQVIDFNNHKSWNVPDYIGEFNAFGTGTSTWQDVVDDFNDDNISWSSWSYKAIHGAAPDSWGLYDPTGTWPAIPAIPTASSSTISTDWSNWTTAKAFAINPMISSVIVGPPPPSTPTPIPNLISVVSMKSHAGTSYSVPLAISGPPGVECRESNGTLQLVFTFDQPMVSGDVSIDGDASIDNNPTFSLDTMTVTLSQVTDVQNMTVTVSDLNGTSGTATVGFGILRGDVDGDGKVTSADVALIRSATGSQTGQAAFNPRCDLNEDGWITSKDSVLERNAMNHQLP